MKYKKKYIKNLDIKFYDAFEWLNSEETSSIMMKSSSEKIGITSSIDDQIDKPCPCGGALLFERRARDSKQRRLVRLPAKGGRRTPVSDSL